MKRIKRIVKENRCAYCDKKIVYKYPSEATRKFCNRNCYISYRRENMSGNETICWTCKNTNGNICSWFSEEMKPVDGWTAEFRPTSDGASYLVRKCPNYERESRV